MRNGIAGNAGICPGNRPSAMRPLPADKNQSAALRGGKDGPPQMESCSSDAEKLDRLKVLLFGKNYRDETIETIRSLAAPVLANVASDLSPANGERANHTKLGKAGD